MADLKISQLPQLAIANISVADTFPIVDAVAGQTKQISIGQLDLRWKALPAAGTANQALVKNSGTDGDVKWATIDKTFVGLSNVNNTADLDKPISNLTQAALNLKANSSALAAKADITYVDTSVATKQDKLPTGTDGYVLTLVSGLPQWQAGGGGGGAVSSVFGRTGAVTANTGDYTAAQVGLGNVDNTADLNKPISTFTQAALNAKQDLLPSGTNGQFLSLVSGSPVWANAPSGLPTGGTTGQVLAKNSSTNYDVVWITVPSPLTTKGDLYTYATGATRLGVGADGLVLVADSTQATGLKWAAANPLTTKGDILGFGSAAVRIPVGTDGQLLTADSGNTNGISWQDRVTLLGTYASPLSVVAANGFNSTDGTLSTTAMEQVICYQGPTASTNTTISATTPIQAHTKQGAKAYFVGCSDTQQLTIATGGTGIKQNGDITSTSQSVNAFIYLGTSWIQFI